MFKLTLLVFCVSVFCATEAQLKSYDGYKVFRLIPRTMEQLHFLHNMALQTTTLDFWTYPSALNNTVDVMVPPTLRTNFEAEMASLNMDKTVMITDVEQLNVQQRSEVVNATSDFRPENEVFPQYFTAYRRLSEIWSLLASIVSANPSIAAIENIGRSTNNRDLRLIKIGVNVGSSSKIIYFIDSAIHAREWVTASTTAYFAQYLIDGYRSNNAAVVALLQRYDFYILPVANPDGYEYTFTNERLWRKTRASNSGSSCVGTDPNRNWSFQWGTAGASTNPCSETFQGSSAANQPETKALQDYLYANRARIRVYIAVHSYSQLLLWAWGYTSSNSPSHSVLQTRGNAAIAALTAVSSTRYTTGTITNVLYAASGNAVDYAYQTCGIIYSYTIELRDTGTYGFQLPASQITPTGRETAAFFVKLAQDLA